MSNNINTSTNTNNIIKKENVTAKPINSIHNNNTINSHHTNSSYNKNKEKEEDASDLFSSFSSHKKENNLLNKPEKTISNGPVKSQNTKQPSYVQQPKEKVKYLHIVIFI